MITKVSLGIAGVLLLSNVYLFNKVLEEREERAIVENLLDIQNNAIKELEVNKEELDSELKELDSKIKKAYSSLSKERKTCEQRIKRIEESFRIFENMLGDING